MVEGPGRGVVVLLLGTGLVAWVFGSSVEGEGGGWEGGGVVVVVVEVIQMDR